MNELATVAKHVNEPRPIAVVIEEGWAFRVEVRPIRFTRRSGGLGEPSACAVLVTASARDLRKQDANARGGIFAIGVFERILRGAQIAALHRELGHDDLAFA